MALNETKFVRENADKIESLILEKGPQSKKDLSTKLSINYYSIRLAVQLLLDEGQLKPADQSARNTRYMLASDTGPNRIIPVIGTDVTGKHKLFKLAEAYKNPNPAGAKAVHDLPMLVTRIFSTAETLNTSGPDSKNNLDTIRFQLEKNKKALEVIVSIYQQILDSGRVWNPVTLSKFPDDIEYDRELIADAYAHFFGPQPTLPTGSTQ